MTDFDDARPQIQALRQRTATLNVAILRINASLDLDTVLHEAVDTTRALTAARYGIIVTIDEAGEVRDFVTSNFTDEEKRRFIEWPDRARFSAHVRDLPGPVRLADWTAYVRSLGLSVELLPACTFMSAPMRHRDVHVGHFFLGDKADGAPFTDEDEEVLTLFASQVASAIANARAHRDERRARAGLEALVETSPVGVAVFDAGTGRPGVVQPRGAAHRRRASHARPSAGTAPGGGRVPARRRARDVPGRAPPGAAARRRGDGARRGGRALGTRRGAASGRSSTRPRSMPKTARWLRWWRPCRTLPRSTRSNGCGPSS